MFVDMSYPQHTDFGKKLNKMWYSTEVYKLLDFYGGYPHNGGEHTFYIKDNSDNILAFLEIFDSEFGSSEETIWLREQIKTNGDTSLKHYYHNIKSKN